MNPLSVVMFRVDASLSIGSGHVMRCLTLAGALSAAGARCVFVSRSHPGHLHDVVRARGFEVIELATGDPTLSIGDDAGTTAHASWLGCDWHTDAALTRSILASVQPDWLVIDHYGLDASWEKAVEGTFGKLLVIDDLADRAHVCDILFDQNLGRVTADYAHLVPSRCKVIVGPAFALLRPEFTAFRNDSLRRPRDTIKRLLITMGGVDQDNATGAVLEAIAGNELPGECEITIVMGRHAPWLQAVQALARKMSRRTEVLIDISDMGRRMACSDLAIGAAGGTSWERCCLGLPALIVVLAENQWPGARALNEANAAITVGDVTSIPERLPSMLQWVSFDGRLQAMSDCASRVSDGDGASKLLAMMETCDAF